MYPAISTNSRRVGVVITTHDNAEHLPACINSVLAQTHAAERLLVVDDRSADGTGRLMAEWYPSVDYEYAELDGNTSGSRPRNHGCRRMADLPYVCCVDADDYLPPDYLERLLEAIETDCRSAAAYARVQQFGDRTGVIDVPYEAADLSRTNCAQAAALIRTDALAQVGGWPEYPHVYGDWGLWRRFRDHGWRLVQGDTAYFWRRHAASMTGRSRYDHQFHWATTLNPERLVTIAVPFVGRQRTLRPLLRAIDAQTWPAEHSALLLFDDSGSRDFNRELRAAAYAFADRYADVRLVRYRPFGASSLAQADEPTDARIGRRPAAAAINHRVAAVWNRIGQLVTTDFVVTLEDDVIPPANAVERLLSRFGPAIDAVSAAYPGRQRDWCAWEYKRARPPSPGEPSPPLLSPPQLRWVQRGLGLQQIDGCGLGCCLMRRTVLTEGPARSSGDGPDGCVAYDANLWADAARRGLRLAIDWDVICEHLL